MKFIELFIRTLIENIAEYLTLNKINLFLIILNFSTKLLNEILRLHFKNFINSFYIIS